MEVSEVGSIDGGYGRVIQFIHSCKSLFLTYIYFFLNPFLLRDACPKGWIKLHCDRQGHIHSAGARHIGLVARGFIGY